MVLQLFEVVLLLWKISTALAQSPALAKSGCQSQCGNVTIPYPFGIGANCYVDEWFSISCNETFNPPKPFLNSTKLEVLEVSTELGIVRVNFPVNSTCGDRSSANVMSMEGSPFVFSQADNRFTGVGCNNLALMTLLNGSTIGGCLSFCFSGSTGGSSTTCNGIDCCQTTIPSDLQAFNTTIENIEARENSEGCKYAFLVDQQWFESNVRVAKASAIQNRDNFPVVLEWRIDRWKYDSLVTNKSISFNNSTLCESGVLINSTSFSNQTSVVRCSCKRGYEGNPYLPEGCLDIDECADPKNIPCLQENLGPTFTCKNTEGSYECHFYGPPEKKKSAVKPVLIGIGASLGLLLVLAGAWWLYKVGKERNNVKRRAKFFKQNGGLLLQEQLSSGEVNVEKIKLFDPKELEKATDHFNVNRILGQGGQGTVYKGMLTDGRIVAVKRSKVVDEGKLRPFINEIVILSQLNHRNVVKLLGCCLETEVPLLVYEFVPNGTLFEYIHEDNEEFPLTWDMRVRIAIEVAGALFYLHSAASIPIYHRDIKSTNILLDDKYRAKVADFGTSRSISIDQTHVTTIVQGTFGYLDPEYFQSSQFTEKSDVYSFGVVLVELLTSQKPISFTRSEQGRSLATYFILSMEENRLFDIVDVRVMKEGSKDQIVAVANLAKRCLDLNGKRRPTMKEVAMELEGTQKAVKASHVEQNHEEIGYVGNEVTGPWDVASTSTSTDVLPLLSSKSR
ncbi:PREDICTED: wall-associated receptor kinase-like 22 [Prunus mume]|uniref:Wall-associated receptor kinase-like 22 n=1 Tax=Prunus mume TaxID=102107 RepID=A0ABM0NTI6_PRUMU|nr:PREDICTED: wall-associated receptor kinase-like 22 [Prunus mume]